MLKPIILTIGLALYSSLYAQRAGKTITVNTTDMVANVKVPTIIDRSTWVVCYTSLTPLYNSFYARTSPCSIAKTGNSYSIKVGAFGKVFSYVQTGGGELNLTKTEILPKNKTSRQIITWSFKTEGYNASLQCSVEVQTLKNKVWVTTTPSAIWLKSYTSVVNFDTITL